MAEIAEIFGFQERQSGYYYNACAYQLFETAVRTGKLPDKPYIQRKMKELRLCGDSLIGRRASSVAGWLRWMVRLTEE